MTTIIFNIRPRFYLVDHMFNSYLKFSICAIISFTVPNFPIALALSLLQTAKQFTKPYHHVSSFISEFSFEFN